MRLLRLLAAIPSVDRENAPDAQRRSLEQKDGKPSNAYLPSLKSALLHPKPVVFGTTLLGHASASLIRAVWEICG